MIKGYIHSTESFGTVDGPGIRFVVFMQGCIMRCKYCHNPDTWPIRQTNEVSAEELVKQVLKYRNYYGDVPKITVTGGEPLLQLDFIIELFTLCKEQHIDTCLDTSGITFNDNDLSKYEALLNVTDLILLDIKHIDNEKHKMLTGQENKNVLRFLEFLDKHNQDVWIRYVVVPNISDDINDVIELRKHLDKYSNIQNIEVLPYHKMGIAKYKALGIPYPLEETEIPCNESIQSIKKVLMEDK
ncbi:MAG: pyruvate formate lyase-activating protein [Erysipelotrichales bacterium]|nr:pyruvate formate lyase-activating protein [Erysipelotrichales bacterium]